MGLFCVRRWSAWVILVIMLVYSTAQANAIEVAGELFVDLKASTYNSGDSIWTNAGSYANFGRDGRPTRVDYLNATPAVVFNGSTDAFVGGTLRNPISAPKGLTGFDPTRSIEVWTLNPRIADEETLVAWGKRGGPDSSNMSFNYGYNGAYGAAGHWGSSRFDVGWIDNNFTPGAPMPNKWHHLTYTYGGAADPVARLYSDGELWQEEDMDEWGFMPLWDLNTHPGPAIAIAAQWDGTGVYLADAVRGSLMIGQVRIHDGVLSDAQIRANYNSEKMYYVDKVSRIPGDYDGNGQLGVADLNYQALAMASPEVGLAIFDENDDGVVNGADRLIWVQDYKKTWMGDADLNGLFDTTDLVVVFAVGKYETGASAGWEEGDWDGDGSFLSGDLVAAFADGGYEMGPKAAVAVPEPSTLTFLMVLAVSAFGVYRRHRN